MQTPVSWNGADPRHRLADAAVDGDTYMALTSACSGTSLRILAGEALAV